MTKQDTNARAEAAPQGDGAPVEISPEMIKAGVEMIADQYGVCGADIAPDLARDVFIAMWAIKKDRDRN